MKTMKLMKLKKTVRESAGFTLVEMAIALVIMAIIIGVILLGSQTTVDKARVTAAVTQLKQVQGAIIEYYNVEPGYPQSLNLPAMGQFLPVQPSSPPYVYTCTTGATGGVSIEYEARDGAEAQAVATAWAGIVGTANASVVSGTDAKAVLAGPPVVCSAF